MKGCRGRRVMLPLIGNPSARWRWMVSLAPRPLYAREDKRFPLNRSLDGPPSRSARFEEQKNFMPLPGVEPIFRSARSLVAILNMLPQLLLNLKACFEITYECKSFWLGLMKWVSSYWSLIPDRKFYALFLPLLNDLFTSPSIVRVIKSRRMRWAGYVARMVKGRRVYRILVGKPEGKRLLGKSRHRWGDNIKMDVQEVGCGGVDWIDLA